MQEAGCFDWYLSMNEQKNTESKGKKCQIMLISDKNELQIS